MSRSTCLAYFTCAMLWRFGYMSTSYLNYIVLFAHLHYDIIHVNLIIYINNLYTMHRLLKSVISRIAWR